MMSDLPQLVVVWITTTWTLHVVHNMDVSYNFSELITRHDGSEPWVREYGISRSILV